MHGRFNGKDTKRTYKGVWWLKSLCLYIIKISGFEMERKSRLFSDKELSLINKRFNGEFRDHDGTFSRITKPKIKEIINFWAPRINILNDIIQHKGKNKWRKRCLGATCADNSRRMCIR